MKFEKFKTVIEEFVQENFEITGCRECHETGNGEIEPLDYKGSYNIALTQLLKILKD